MLTWRMYYGDGSAYSNADGGPEDAPARNVQVVAYRDEAVGYALLCGDYYVYDMLCAGWRVVDIFGLWDYLAQPGAKTVKFGRTLPDDEFRAIWQRAEAEFGSKASHYPWERRPK